MLLWWGQAVYQDGQLSSTSTEDAGQPAKALDVLHSILDMLCQHDTPASLAQNSIGCAHWEDVCLRCNTQISSETNTCCMHTSMAAAVMQLLQLGRFLVYSCSAFFHTIACIRFACSSILQACFAFLFHTSFLFSCCKFSFGQASENLTAFAGVCCGVQGIPSLLSPLQQHASFGGAAVCFHARLSSCRRLGECLQGRHSPPC